MTIKSKHIHSAPWISEDSRYEITALLQERLADSIDLMLQVRQAHWNVRRPVSLALTEWLGKVFTDTSMYVDIIAERIVQLGGLAHGTIRVAAKNSSLPVYPLDLSNGRKHIARLAHAITFYGEAIRKTFARSAQLGDGATADLLAQVLRGADASLWFVETHELVEH